MTTSVELKSVGLSPFDLDNIILTDGQWASRHKYSLKHLRLSEMDFRRTNLQRVRDCAG